MFNTMLVNMHGVVILLIGSVHLNPLTPYRPATIPSAPQRLLVQFHAPTDYTFFSHKYLRNS